MKTIPLRVIANKLGCSRSTVSYALRNMACISVELRGKIQAMAHELGWVPDAELAKQLAMVRATGTRNLPNLALVLNKPPQELAEQHAPRKHFEGAVQRAHDLGYQLEVFNLAEKILSPARLRSVLQARGIQGIVYLATTGQGTTLDSGHLEIGHNFACSVLGIRYPNPPYHVAIGNLHSTGQLAIAELAQAGFKRPGAVLPRGLDRMLAWSFGGGIQAGNFELPMRNRVPICYVGETENFVPESSFAKIKAWMEREKPDVLVTTDMKHLPQVLELLPKRAPKIRICSLDFHAGLTQDFGVDQRNEAVGAAAVDLVVAQLHRGERGIPSIQRTLQIEGKWVGHFSSARAPRKPSTIVS